MSGTPTLASPRATAELLKRHGFHTRKKYGQNFLIDAHVPEKIVAAAEISEEDCVLEIGPGIGTLTQFLAQKAGRVIAVEIDDDLLPVLAETLSDYPSATVVHADILKTDLHTLLQDHAGDRPVKVVANLPYYITTPILMQLLESDLPIVSYTLMVQKEVAERMTAEPGGKEYGALSLAVQYRTKPRIVMQVSPSCFLPRPGVGSTVIHLRARAGGGEQTQREPAADGRREDFSIPLPKDEERRLFQIIRGAFGQRRKTLANALANSPALGCSRSEVEAALVSCGLRPDIRGEMLGLREFIKLEKEL